MFYLFWYGNSCYFLCILPVPFFKTADIFHGPVSWNCEIFKKIVFKNTVCALITLNFGSNLDLDIEIFHLCQKSLWSEIYLIL